MMSFLYCIFLIQFFNLVVSANFHYDNHIAFYCGKPSMVFENQSWIADYKQDCIKNEIDIVSYCRKTFFAKNISSAEPAMEKSIFTKWCDFEGKNCLFNVSIRPFKCLESFTQSDELVIPQNCLFGHLGGDVGCKSYSNWVVDARKKCSKKSNFEVRSFGMLFQCNDSKNNKKSMFFKGVEFVCCPKSESARKFNDNNVDQNNFHPYIIKGVLETEDEENKTYESSLKNLNNVKQEWKKKIVDDYMKGENELKKDWWNEPRSSKKKEHKLISKFKSKFIGMIFRLRDKEEKLLGFHDNRLKLLFTTKLDMALRKMKTVFRNPVATEKEVRDSMVIVLDLLMLRKKEIHEDRVRDKRLNNLLIPSLNEELKMIDSNITGIFNLLDKLPQYKIPVKQYLLLHMMRNFPRISFGKEQNGDDFPEMEDIIAKYKYRQEIDPKSVVQLDPDFDNKDQNGHQDNVMHVKYSTANREESIFSGRNIQIIIFVCIFITLTALVLMVVLLLRVRHQSRMARKIQLKHWPPLIRDDQLKSPRIFKIIINPSFPDNGILHAPVHSELKVACTVTEKDDQNTNDSLTKPLID